MDLQSPKLDFNDVLIVPQKSNLNSRKDVNLYRNFKFKNGKELNCIPIMASNMDTVGTIVMAKELKKYGVLTCLHKHYNQKWFEDNFSHDLLNSTFLSLGIKEYELDKLNERLNPNYNQLICIDVANGYISKFLDTIKIVREKYPNSIICAGNVVTPEGCEEIFKAGADIAKIGIGSSKNFCRTRIKTGIGYPQLSAILECKEVADKHNCYLMSDGGCSIPGDIAKAFVAGADFVMIGTMLSGHDECELETFTDEKGDKYGLSYGMSSSHAMNKHHGGVAEYRTSEGEVHKVQLKGPVKDTILDILGGLRSCGTYINAKTISEFPINGNFIKVNRVL